MPDASRVECMRPLQECAKSGELLYLFHGISCSLAAARHGLVDSTTVCDLKWSKGHWVLGSELMRCSHM